MIISTLSKIQIRCDHYQTFALKIITIVMLAVTACSSGLIKEAVATSTVSPSDQVKVLVTEQYPGFEIYTDNYLTGDFNADSLTDHPGRVR
jgi:hypothetical protein